VDWLAVSVVRDEKSEPSTPQFDFSSAVLWILSLVPISEVVPSENLKVIQRQLQKMRVKSGDLDKYLQSSTSISLSMAPPELPHSELLLPLMRNHQFHMIQLLSPQTTTSNWVHHFDPWAAQWTCAVSPRLFSIVCMKSVQFVKEFTLTIEDRINANEPSAFLTFLCFMESLLRDTRYEPSQNSTWMAFLRNGEQLLVKLLARFQYQDEKGPAQTVYVEIFHSISRLMTRFRFKQFTQDQSTLSFKKKQNSSTDIQQRKGHRHHPTGAIAEVLIHPPLLRLFLEAFDGKFDSKEHDIKSVWDSIFNVVNVTLSLGARGLVHHGDNCLQPGDVGLSFFLSDRSLNCVRQLLVGGDSKKIPCLFVLQFIVIWITCQSTQLIRNCAELVKDIVRSTQHLKTTFKINRVADLGCVEDFLCQAQRLQIIFILQRYSIVAETTFITVCCTCKS